MSRFSTDWLRLREPFDHAARSAALRELHLRDAVAMAQTGRPGGQALRITDLACGSGANVRELAPRLGGAQQWRLVDHDTGLLAAVPQVLNEWAEREGHRVRLSGDVIHVQGSDFSAELHRVALDLAHTLPHADLASADLVTASALLDLVSAAWLEQLLQALEAGTASLLFALTVDGYAHWSPSDPDDAAVQALFTQHQQRDKGFGAALGAAAAMHAAQRLRAVGYQVQQARSNWFIDATAHAPQRQAVALIESMVDGMAGAAVEQDPQARAWVDAWRIRRFASLGDSKLEVGHVDLLCTRGDLLAV